MRRAKALAKARSGNSCVPVNGDRVIGSLVATDQFDRNVLKVKGIVRETVRVPARPRLVGGGEFSCLLVTEGELSVPFV